MSDLLRAVVVGIHRYRDRRLPDLLFARNDAREGAEMFDDHGLQIDMRCVKCGSTGTRVSLWEMKKHLYICNDCRLREEQQGKVFAWTADVSEQSTIPLPSISTALLPQIPVLPPAAEPDLFSLLNLSPEAGREKVIAAIRQSMRDWMALLASEATGAQIELLRTCQERLNNDERYLARERARLRPPEPEGSVLIVGSRPARTIEEFVALCGESSQGWSDREKHLRSGELEYWTLARTEDRQLARIVRQAMQKQTSDFYALNVVFYRLWPRRPLCLFSSASWQPLQPQDSARLAGICAGLPGVARLVSSGCPGLRGAGRRLPQPWPGTGARARCAGHCPACPRASLRRAARGVPPGGVG